VYHPETNAASSDKHGTSEDRVENKSEGAKTINVSKPTWHR
jgi:hypothetical protein